MKKIFETIEKAACAWLTIYFFLLAIFVVFRLSFTFFLSDYMGDGVTFLEIAEAQYRGALLSMTSAGYIGIIVALPFFFYVVFEKNFLLKLSKIVVAAVLFLLSLLHIASFPFYRTFRENFNQMVFRGINEDWTALLATFYEEFALPVRLVAAVALAFIIYKVFVYIYARDYVSKIFSPLPKIISIPILVVSCYITVLWTLFGGALSWEHQVDFENSGVMGDNFLNEAILDSPQAIFRGYTQTQRVLACNGLDFTAADVKRLAAVHSGKAEDSDNLDYYLSKKSKGAKIPKPKHIFVILAESYAVWPLLDEYENLHIADGMREIMRRENSDYSLTMLPDGSSTVSAVMGAVTGLADANLYLTAMDEAYVEPYSTAVAPIFKRLGYKTNFYYAGPATWENIGAFTKAQGFENFISKGDFVNQEGSVWGVKDAILFDKVLEDLSDETSFNIILTASNHSPFDLDLKSENIPVEAIKKALPETVQGDEWLIKELGHFYY
ncbi:MAG: sulfatase-like hydrolase/transferase, partial [Selenomonadaceae bacterium]|nr:sulfatase-like hydrolase/transferase [Selenomonadaceae bacterium]